MRQMQKEIETEKSIGLFVTFLSLVAFQLKGKPVPHPWLCVCYGLIQTKQYFGLIQTKQNLGLTQNNKTSVIFWCLQAKLLLF